MGVGDDRGGVGDVGSFRDGNFVRDADAFRDEGVGGVDDAGIGVPGIDGGEGGADVLGGDDLSDDLRPEAELAEILLRIDTRRHARGFRERDVFYGTAGEVRG